MKVKDLLKICGEMANLNLNEENIESELETQGSSVRQLLNCCNFTLEELYRDYASSIRKTVVEVVDGFADTSAFKLSKVISLVDGEGNDVKYRYTEGGLSVDEDGKYNLCYARLPNDVGLDDDVSLPSPRISERMLAYGILREYFTIIGDTLTASQWDERYKDSLRIADVKSSSMRMPVGRWL
ncbi:MAG: hypothetical protein J1F66_04295 [Clostridiales bacterium]|nr:hypothetical protein [Clostridiales bacterium]